MYVSYLFFDFHLVTLLGTLFQAVQVEEIGQSNYQAEWRKSVCVGGVNPSDSLPTACQSNSAGLV